MAVVSILALAFAALLLVPTLTFAIECILGSLPRTAKRRSFSDRPPVAVIVPAHNEQSGVGATLRSIRAQMKPGDRLLVVADNCDDLTADTARAEGAEVIERYEATKRGKGFALSFGLDHLRQAPPPVVVFVDADCSMTEGALDELARSALLSGRPVQACNLMTAPAEATLNHKVAEFAFLVKNYVRPLGLARLGLPCQLTGTGMALPWSVADNVEFGSSNIVEDMQLGLDLARIGQPPLYCEVAGVRSTFPTSAAGAALQRKRWEHGHLAMVWASARSLLQPSLFRNPSCLALTLDVLVPPLTLLTFCIGATLAATFALAVNGYGAGALYLAGLNAALLTVAVISAWVAHGRHTLSARALSGIPAYILGKLWIYSSHMLGRSERTWIRADRSRHP